MQKSLFFKLFIIFVMSLMLMIPLLMISNLADGRESYSREVREEIAGAVGSDQNITAPVIRIDYEVSTFVQTYKENGKTIKNVEWTSATTYILPKELNITGVLNSNVLNRGIHSAIVYDTTLELSGFFEIPKNMITSDSTLRNVSFSFLTGISSMKGLNGKPTLVINGTDRNPTTTRALASFESNGLVAPLYFTEIKSGTTIPFKILLPLKGYGKLFMAPLGETTTVNLSGSWPHPKFSGNILPTTRSVNENGFTASWDTSWYSNSIQKEFESTYNSSIYIDQYFFGVELVSSIDIYSLVDRSIKYGYLFIFLTFLIFFVLETVTKSKIHPIQYGFVGIAIAIFFLLLLSLSEHISFALSYFLAASACLALITFYISVAFKSKKQTAIFSGFIAMLYVAMFTLLHASDYALLLGSGLVFVILAIVMIASRKIDWYTQGNK